MHKILTAVMAIAIVAAIGFTLNPIQNTHSAFAQMGSMSSSAAPAATSTCTKYPDCEAVEPIANATGAAMDTSNQLPTEEWFHFAGLSLNPGEFLDLVDTTPFMVTKGHMAMVVPCETDAKPDVLLYEGILDMGSDGVTAVNTLEPVQPQYLPQVSDPAHHLCVMHFDIGKTTNNPYGTTDFVLMNVSHHVVNFGMRNTSTFSLDQGYFNANG